MYFDAEYYEFTLLFGLHNLGIFKHWIMEYAFLNMYWHTYIKFDEQGNVTSVYDIIQYIKLNKMCLLANVSW